MSTALKYPVSFSKTGYCNCLTTKMEVPSHHQVRENCEFKIINKHREFSQYVSVIKEKCLSSRWPLSISEKCWYLS